MKYSIRIFDSADDSILFVCHCEWSDIEFLLDNIDFTSCGYRFQIEVL